MILATNTTLILIALRQLLVQNNLAAYIIPAGDAHYTEFVAECHERRAYVSGFTGSAGTAIVTTNYAALWTDGRYFLQAENQLDENWTLMKDGMPDTLSQSQWLIANLTGPSTNVGVDPKLFTKGQWDTMYQELLAGNKNLTAIETNLIDEVWTGKNTSEKVAEVRKSMTDNSAGILVVTELDEVAWLLNLRGRDIPSSSIFFAYVIVTQTSLEFFVNRDQINQTVENILRQNVPEIELKPYETVFTELINVVSNTSITGKVWLSRNANYALVSSVPDADRVLLKTTPIALMKAVKNSVEVDGYRKALIRDAAALCEFFAWLEPAMQNGELVTEISASNKLLEIRSGRENFVGNSFTTISSSGPNGAVIHYMPTPETDRALAISELYLLDSGGLYFDGTTDITRTVHFGTPSAYQKECYTRVLKGQISLATAIFPFKTVGHRLDSFARQALWSVGLDYAHGTGHGIGSFLNVHEGPFSIGSGYRADDPGLQENMFTSNEPGYYEDNQFGIRLENIIRVQNVTLHNNFQMRGFLGFEDLTFVPYQHKMIDFNILTVEEIQYLNDYQVKARQLVGDYITQSNLSQAAYDWLIKETPPIGDDQSSSSTTGSSNQSSSSTPPSTTGSSNQSSSSTPPSTTGSSNQSSSSTPPSTTGSLNQDSSAISWKYDMFLLPVLIFSMLV